MSLKRLSLVLSLVVVMSMLATVFVFAQGPDDLQIGRASQGETAVYIIQLQDAPAATYRGGIEGLPATSAAVTGRAKMDAESADAVAYRAYLATQRASAVDSISKTLGRAIELGYVYDTALNGFSVELTAAEASQIERLSAVKFIEKDREYDLHTDYGPAWIGAKAIWDSGATNSKGEGVIVGVIDTGIDPYNPSFLDVGGDSYDHDNPRSKLYGVCDPTNTSPPDGTTPYSSTLATLCNDKLIGMWGYDGVNGGDPSNDTNGHGSHTASTAAGNVVKGAVITTPTGVFSADISGVAPHANIIAYAACCTGAALNAAIDQVVKDKVDVVNYSIGSTSASNWNWASSQAWLAVREAGIFVATSAGNAGPGDATVGSPGDLPWMTVVGANSHNRTFLNSMTVGEELTGTGSLLPALTVSGQSMTGPLITPTRVVYSSWYTANGKIDADDARLCADDVFSGTVDFGGAIVVCERGGYGRVAKGQTVKDAGAGGYILAQPNEFGGGPGSLAPDPHVLPAVHIDYYQYQALKTYMASSNNVITGTIAGSTMAVDDKYGNIMASFSSRGPNRGVADLLVPKVTAPGRAIWAAYHTGDKAGEYSFNVIQGTSMSSPHVAGAGALLRAMHPDWTPAEIESALMSTANTAIKNDDGVKTATPFAQGSGQINLANATKAGFVLDVPANDFKTTNPFTTTPGDPKTLNLANAGNAACVVNCSWTRTLSSTMDSTVDWTVTTVNGISGTVVSVTPSSFTLPAGGTQVLTITADVASLKTGVWDFGQVDFTPNTTETVAAHFPVGVMSANSDMPETLKVNDAAVTGTVTAKDVKAIAVTAMQVAKAGFAEADFGQAYIENEDYKLYKFSVPAGTVRMVSEILDTTSPDIDMGFLDSAFNWVCLSASGGSDEYCNVDNPAAGDYYLYVENYEASAAGTDRTSWTLGLVGADAGNMTVTAPSSQAAGATFDMGVEWDLSGSAGSSVWYGAVTLGTDAASAGNLGTTNVDIYRKVQGIVEGDTDELLDNVAEGITATITVPAGAFQESDDYLQNVPFSAVMQPVSGTLTFVGLGLDLTAYNAAGQAYDTYAFNGVVTITISYDDSLSFFEDTLDVFYWDADAVAWSSDGVTVVSRNPASNTLVVRIAHLTEYAMFGVQQVPVSSVQITRADGGQGTGSLNWGISFRAETNAGATKPVTFTWQATDKQNIVYVDNPSRATSNVSYTWDTTGTKTITVTAVNAFSSGATDVITVSVVKDAPPPTTSLYLPIVMKNN